MKAVVVSVAVIAGLAFIGLAALYWLTPAGELPAFLPGFKPGAMKPHFNHGLGTLIIGLAALVFAWFSSRASWRAKAHRR
jgi:hypothetical protein